MTILSSQKSTSTKHSITKLIIDNMKLKNLTLLLSTTSLTACLGSDDSLLNVAAVSESGFTESPTGTFTAQDYTDLTLFLGDRTDNLTVYSGNANDTITTGSGDDTIMGEGGNDWINAGSGNDQITTGSGNDIIIFNSGFGLDTITDFTDGSDILYFKGTGLHYDDLNITQDGFNVTINDGSGNILTLNNIDVSDISELDFIINKLPTGSVTITGTAAEDEVLTASNTLVDADGLGTITYQWQRDGVDVDGATGETYTLTQDDVGAVITVVAGYTDGGGVAESVTSSATSVVVNEDGDPEVNNAPTGTVTITGTATEDQTLTASNTLADEDGLGAITYQWQRDGVDITDATNATYDLIQADVGAVITVVASYTDGEGTDESVTSDNTSAVINVSHSTTGTVTITGTATEGETLAASNTLADEDGLGAITYQWQRDGVDITGATDSNYYLVQDDVDAVITVIASHTDGEGTNESVSSFGTSAVEELSVLQLASLDGTFGFRLDGVAADDQSGWSVSNAGDFNGDGFDDLIIGAKRADPNGAESGSSYVLFGTDANFGADANLGTHFDLLNLDGTNGFRLDGEVASDESGYSVSNAGDVNGDGFDDLIIGAWGADPNGAESGSSYVVFGTASNMGTSFDLSNLDGTNGFRLDGEVTDDQSGWSVSSAGDINGDGFDDMIIGAYAADPNGAASGSTYVVFGADDWTANSGIVDLSTLDGTDGFRLDGEVAGDESGYSVSNAGDVNGDGFDDLIIGARYAEPNGNLTGSSYVVFGTDAAFAATVDLSTLDGTNGFRLDGDGLTDLSGQSVSNAGDINGDGFDDLIVSAHLADPNGASSGSTYVVFGADDWTANAGIVDLSSLDGTNGFRLDGEVASDESGYSVSSAGDINGDGFDDLIIGAWGADPNGSISGSSYVVFGTDAAFAATIDLSTLDGTNGFRIDGEVSGDRSGISVSSAGDINSDGYDDLIIGAYSADPNGSGSGSTYVIYGGTQWTSSVATDGEVVTGDGAANVLIGSSYNDIIYGLAGDDILKGGAGTDTLYGGVGSDDLYGGGRSRYF